MRYLLPLLLVLALAGCAPSAAAPSFAHAQGLPTAPGNPDEAYNAAVSTMREAQRAIDNTRQAGTATIQAATMDARYTRDAVGGTQTAAPATSTAQAAIVTQAAQITADHRTEQAQHTEAAGTQQANYATQDAGHATDTAEALVAGARLQATTAALDSAAKAQQVSDFAIAVLKFGAALTFALLGLGVGAGWFRRRWEGALWVVYPRAFWKAPQIAVNHKTGEAVDLGPALPAPVPQIPAPRAILVNGRMRDATDWRTQLQQSSDRRNGIDIRAKALKLLTMAAHAYDPNSTDGWRAGVIPSDDALQAAGYTINTREWSTVVGALKAAGVVSTKQGRDGGTYTNGRTLGEVYRDVETGAITLPYPAERWPQSANTERLGT